MYLKYSKPDEIRMGDIYRSWDGNHFMIIGFHVWSETNLGRIAYIQTIGSEKSDQRTLDYILNHCSLASRVKA
jgi:hypothetical protein